MTLVEGEILIATTYTSGGTDADTIITLSGGAIASGEEIVNDDYNSVDYFSQVFYAVPADGTYYIAVTPWCGTSSCGFGDYALHILVLDPDA